MKRSHVVLLSLLGFAVSSSVAACAVPASPEAHDNAALTSLDPKLEAAALANLRRIAREIDADHLANYGALPAATDPTFGDVVATKFLDAVKLEYQATPALLKRRVETLASMVFFSAPEVETDAKIGRVTPFHGMDDAAFQALMQAEDFVFDSHVAANGGSPNGVRPFSVCETKFLIGVAKGEVADASFVANRALTNYDAYAHAFQTYAAGCAQADLDEWYNFRGLGGLRPSWLESNYNDRVLRKMLKSCKAPTAELAPACDEFAKNRLAYRDKLNVGLALREMVYSTDAASQIDGMSDEAYMGNPQNAGLFVVDQNGDGVAEWIAPGPVDLVPGAAIKLADGTATKVSADGKTLTATGKTFTIASASLAINQTTQFGGSLVLTLGFADGTQGTAKVTPRAIQPIERVQSGWSPALLQRKDLGLGKLFPDGSGCLADAASPDTCPLVRRFYSLIDRHESFYQTYSTFEPDSSNVSSQPSPLVACSITLGASHQWDSAGTPPGGTAGFIYLTRIPYAEVLSGDVRSIDTLGRLKGDLKSGPKVLTLQQVYASGEQLDMGKLWVDIATLSHNQYSNEHEVSKFGTVPAEQIEGVLVVRRPAAMPAPPPPVVAPATPAADAGAQDVDAGAQDVDAGTP